ncbi:putative GEM-like protein 8 [Cannabis sativa]|uniref:putative GEM-like protein 8 n=1 Tax=Cannabis sativa TaxID=3483 RepID=UPI0029C9BEED|nr:putative GEM-like protein 8 [Cannabis sativa]
MKTLIQGQVIGIPIASVSCNFDQRSTSKALLLTDAATQFHTDKFPEDVSSTLKKSKIHSVLNRMNKLGKKADIFAHGIKEHVRMGPKITETVKGKLSLGARILQVGGVEKIFKQLFSVGEGEKLLKASQCYLSTTAGPIAGLLFISSVKIAFCSEKSIKFSSPNGELIRARYKVVIPVIKIKGVNESENVKKPSQKYIEIVTVDNFDFWFMGFFNHQKAFKCLQQAVSQA